MRFAQRALHAWPLPANRVRHWDIDAQSKEEPLPKVDGSELGPGCVGCHTLRDTRHLPSWFVFSARAVLWRVTCDV